MGKAPDGQLGPLLQPGTANPPGARKETKATRAKIELKRGTLRKSTCIKGPTGQSVS